MYFNFKNSKTKTLIGIETGSYHFSSVRRLYYVHLTSTGTPAISRWTIDIYILNWEKRERELSILIMRPKNIININLRNHYAKDKEKFLAFWNILHIYQFSPITTIINQFKPSRFLNIKPLQGFINTFTGKWTQVNQFFTLTNN